MAKFKNNKVQYIYDLYTVEPPKARGSGMSSYYFRAIDFPKMSPPVRGSLAYGAWAAGRDYLRRATAKQ